MRKIKQKKSPLNLVLNTLKPHETDPTLLECKFIILDFEVSGNNTLITKETAMDTLAKSIINKPIRAYYIENKDDFGGHEVELKEDEDGNITVERNTVPMGTFTTEGYIETIEIDGEMKEVLCADAVLWRSQFEEPCELLLKWFDEGVKINMSCEYLYKNFAMVDGVEEHLSPIYLEAHCLLGSQVVPSYDSATLVTKTQLNEFKTLVAQAVNQDREKEENGLAEKLETHEETEVVETSEEEVADTPTDEMKTQVHELSHDDIRQQIRDQVKAYIQGESWVWVYDVYETYAVVEVEFTENEDYTYKFYKFDYSIENEIVTVDTSTQEEVKQKREWVVVTNELEKKLKLVESEKAELETKFNEATNTILSLNSTIEELKPLQEEFMKAQHEQKLNELTEKFEKAFNNANASEQFKSEDVQNLLVEAVNSSEALLQLNSMVVDLISDIQLEEKSGTTLLGLNSSRKNLADTPKSIEDEFAERFMI